jgi:hypothetical protein
MRRGFSLGESFTELVPGISPLHSFSARSGAKSDTIFPWHSLLRSKILPHSRRIHQPGDDHPNLLIRNDLRHSAGIAFTVPVRAVATPKVMRREFEIP